MVLSVSSCGFLTSTATCSLCLLLLLQAASVCGDSEATLVKTIGSKSDLTPVCTNETQSIITLIVCKIRTERSREECRLLYRHGQDFVHECDSRFTLTAQNQSVFLQLTSLKPEDSGNYTCQCSFNGGTNILHLDITVEDVNSSTQLPIQSRVLIGALVVSIMAGVFGIIHRKIYHRRQPESPAGHTNTEPPDIEAYSIFMQRESGLYSTVRVYVCHTDTDNSDMFPREDTR